MTDANFDRCLSLILKEEGGDDDDPNDHGGRTSRGITQREYDVYRRSRSELPADVWQAPQDAVNDIYRRQYWNPYCDNLPAGIDLCFFNASVNSGRQQAVKEAQRALGVKVDGMMGMETLGAIAMPQDYKLLVHGICEYRRAFYRALKQFPRYGRGWLARTDRIEAAAKEMAPAFDASAVVASGSTKTASIKADPDDVKQPPIATQTAAGGAAASTVGTGIVDQLQQLAGQLSPFQDTLKWAKIGCIVIAVICAGFAIYAVVHKRKIEAVT